jgi:hypothetical protein
MDIEELTSYYPHKMYPDLKWMEMPEGYAVTNGWFFFASNDLTQLHKCLQQYYGENPECPH